MATRKQSAANPKSPVPEYVRDAPIMRKRKVTNRKLPSFTQAMLLVHTPALLQEYFAALLGGLKAGDKVALEQVGEIFNYVKGRGISLSMNQQILQANAAAGEQAPVIGYDTLVRQIAESRAGRALPAPSTAVDIRPADTTVTVTAEA